jgi:hypothetical protein
MNIDSEIHYNVRDTVRSSVGYALWDSVSDIITLHVTCSLSAPLRNKVDDIVSVVSDTVYTAIYETNEY